VVVEKVWVERGILVKGFGDEMLKLLGGFENKSNIELD
jgi:hypothetical protein